MNYFFKREIVLANEKNSSGVLESSTQAYKSLHWLREAIMNLKSM